MINVKQVYVALANMCTLITLHALLMSTINVCNSQINSAVIRDRNTQTCMYTYKTILKQTLTHN